MLNAVEGHKPAVDGAEPGNWTQDYDAALKFAAEKNLPLLLNFTGSDWCGWCKLMDKNVFAKEEWQNYAKGNLVLVTLDFPKDKSIVPDKWVGRNNDLKTKFGIRGYPTYVILDKDGETKLGQLGASRNATPENFVEQTGDVIFFSESALAEFAKSIPGDKAEKFDALLSKRSAANKELEKAKSALQEWVKTRPEKNAANDKLFAGFQKDIRSASEKVDSASKSIKTFK